MWGMEPICTSESSNSSNSLGNTRHSQVLVRVESALTEKTSFALTTEITTINGVDCIQSQEVWRCLEQNEFSIEEIELQILESFEEDKYATLTPDNQTLLPLSVSRTSKGSTLYLQVKIIERETSKAEDQEEETPPVLGKEGRAWLFGRDWNKTQHHKPFLFKDLEIIDFSCGSSHFLALTKDGNVYSWGSAKHGKLGQLETADISVPRLVQSFTLSYKTKVIKVACGPYHSVAISEQGHVYAWGETTISDDCSVHDLAGPVPVNMQELKLNTFIDVCTALNHVAAISSGTE
jgi:hypothetical protein